MEMRRSRTSARGDSLGIPQRRTGSANGKCPGKCVEKRVAAQPQVRPGRRPEEAMRARFKADPNQADPGQLRKPTESVPHMSGKIVARHLPVYDEGLT